MPGGEEGFLELPFIPQKKANRALRLRAFVAEKAAPFLEQLGIDPEKLFEKTEKGNLRDIPKPVYTWILQQHHKGNRLSPEEIALLPKWVRASANGTRVGVNTELKGLLKEQGESKQIPYSYSDLIKGENARRALQGKWLPVAGMNEERQVEIAKNKFAGKAEEKEAPKDPADAHEYWLEKFITIRDWYKYLTTAELAKLTFIVRKDRLDGILWGIEHNKKLADLERDVSEEVEDREDARRFRPVIKAETKAQKEMEAARRFYSSESYNNIRLLASMVGFGHSYNVLFKALRFGERKFLQITQAISDELRAQAPEIFGKEFVNLEENKRDVELTNGSTVKLNSIQLISLKLKADDRQHGKNARAHGFYEDDVVFESKKEPPPPLIPGKEVNKVISQLNPQELRAVAAIRAAYQKLTDYLHEFAETLPPVERKKLQFILEYLHDSYAHARPAGVVKSKDQSLIDLWRFSWSSRSLWNAIRERVPHDHGLKIGDSIKELTYVANTVGSIVGKQDVAEMFQAVLKVGTKTNNLLSKSKHGRDTLHFLSRGVAKWQGIVGLYEMTDAETFIRARLKSFSIGQIAGRVSTFLLQPVSFLVGSTQMDLILPRYFAKALKSGPISTEKSLRYQKLSPIYRARVETPISARISPMVMKLFGDVFYKEGGVLAWVSRKLLYPTKWMDEQAICKIYEAGELQAKDFGWSEKEWVDRAEQVAYITQMTPSAMNEAEIQRLAKEGHLFESLVSMFQNETIRQYNTWAMELQRYRESPKDPEDKKRLRWVAFVMLFALTVAINTSGAVQRTAMSAAGNIIRRFSGDKRSPEEIWRDAGLFKTKNVLARSLRSLIGLVGGPTMGWSAEVLLSGAMGAMGEPMPPTYGNPMSELANMGTSVMYQGMQMARLVAIGDVDDEKIGNKILGLTSSLLKLGPYVGAPGFLAEFASALKTRDRSYYSKMYFDALCHSNGAPRSNPSSRSATYAVRRWMELGGTEQGLETSLRNRIQRAMK